MNRFPTYFISHGGGPWPFMKDLVGPAYHRLEISLQQMMGELPQTPKCILMISGHWEEQEFTVMTSPRPTMLYDYSGFPPSTYTIQYPAHGSPELADRIASLWPHVQKDPKRGFDHGAFTPLAVMLPEANVPVVQLSLRHDYDPETHLRLGEALSTLRSDGVLIIGSGLSYHNLRLFNERARAPSQEFDQWLTHTVCDLTGEARWDQLCHWERAPSARVAHPREDHLIPLMVAVGAAKDERGTRVYHEEDFMGGISVSSFRLG